MLAKVAARIERERMLATGETLGVAVSGGPDSVALLHVLRELYPDRSWVILHVNHGWRGADSDTDERFVRDLAVRLDCECLVRGRSLDARTVGVDGNLEQIGRQCRYDFFRDAIAHGRCASVATGHTRSDQAETVLFRLLRGAAGTGLSGIWPVLDKRIVRPMLDVSRAEVLEYLAERGIPSREDASNVDRKFARNRLRHDLLPILRRDWNPNIESVLASTADWALEEQRYWELRIAEIGKHCLRSEAGGIALDVASVRALLPAEQRRLIHHVLKLPELGAGSANFGHIDSVRDLIGTAAGSGAVDLPGLRAERSFDTVLIRARAAVGVPVYDFHLPVPGCVALPQQQGAAVRARLLTSAERLEYHEKECDLLDWSLVSGPLRLRNWRPGDRYRPTGQRSARKLKDLFQRSRVSSWRRAAWPVVTRSDGDRPDRIVWVRGFGPASEFAARPDSPRLLSVDELRVTDRPEVPESLPSASYLTSGTIADKDPLP